MSGIGIKDARLQCQASPSYPARRRAPNDARHFINRPAIYWVYRDTILTEFMVFKMTREATTDNDLAQIEAIVASRRLRLAFAPELEARFVATDSDARLAYFVTTSIMAIVLYDIFLLNDWLVLRDRFEAMLVARLAIASPILIGLIVLNVWRRSDRGIEWSAAFAAILAVVLPMTVMTTSDSPHKLVYQTGTLLVMMFATVIQGVRLVPSIVATMTIVAIQMACVARVFDAATTLAITTFFLTAAVLLLVAVYFHERTERRAFLLAERGRILHARLTDVARRDGLTRLFNRRHLGDVLDDLWRGETTNVAAVLLDIDHFKLFNDNYGHQAGDACLQTVSACVQDAAGSPLAFRFGGEEVLVLFPATKLDEAIERAEVIRLAIAAAKVAHPVLGRGSHVSASFGVACVGTDRSSASDLIAEADRALYEAKRNGRNRVRPLRCLCEPMAIDPRPFVRRSA